MKIVFLFVLLSLSSLYARDEDPWGKDSGLIEPFPSRFTEVTAPPNLATKAAKKVISFHQNFLSPTTGPRSSFRPTSSRYMELAIKRYGFLKGYIMGCDRLLRENNEPWIYRTVEDNGVKFKYDPAIADKFQR